MSTPAPAQPKVHPLIVGGAYGLGAALVNFLTYYLNHGSLDLNNGFLGFAGTFLLPLIGLYLAGHYAGRHERLTNQKLETTGLALRSVWFGTGAGTTAGVLYVIFSQVLNTYVAPVLSTATASGGGAFGTVLGALGLVAGIIGWLFGGLLLGTLGGVFGDSRAHADLKKTAVVAK